MRQVTASTRASTVPAAVAELLAVLRAGLAGASPDLLLLFAGPGFGAAGSDLPAVLSEGLGGVPVVGCSGAGVLSEDGEIEDGAGAVVSALVIPEASLGVVHVPPDDDGVAAIDVDTVRAKVPLGPDVPGVVLLFADPFSARVEPALAALDVALPACTITGGLASGGRTRGTCTVYAGQQAHHDGVALVWMAGGVEADVIVSQGCRPVGPPLEITEAEGPVVRALDAAPALGVLQETIGALDGPSLRAFRRAPLVGIDPVKSERVSSEDPWLVRQLLGVDPGQEAFAVGTAVGEGDRLRLHVRDPLASVEDLGEALGRWRRSHPKPDAVVMMTCLGRGQAFYGRPDVDTRVVREQLGDVAVAGFFANGEIGPIRQRTWLHGHTAVVVLLRAAAWN